MERLFDILLWAAAGGLGFAVPGALFGSVVRAVALRRGEAYERSVSEALGNGAWSGGLFLGTLGLIAGVGLGWLQPEVEYGLPLLGQLVASVVLLMGLAGSAGGLALFLFWLGARLTGVLLAVAVVLGFAGVVAWKKGIEVAIVLATQGVVGMLCVLAATATRWFEERRTVETEGDYTPAD